MRITVFSAGLAVTLCFCGCGEYEIPAPSDGSQTAAPVDVAEEDDGSSQPVSAPGSPPKPAAKTAPPVDAAANRDASSPPVSEPGAPPAPMSADSALRALTTTKKIAGTPEMSAVGVALEIKRMYGASGAEPAAGGEDDAVVGELVARAAALRERLVSEGYRVSLVEATCMVYQAMACVLPRNDPAPPTEQAYQALVDELSVAATDLDGKLDQRDYVVSLLEAFGMASQAMTCHLIRSDGGPQTKEAYEKLRDDIASSAIDLQDKLKGKEYVVSLVEAFGMASQAMVCHFCTNGGAPPTREAYEKLLDDIASGAIDLRDKLRGKEYVVSLVEAFGMASQAMVCHLFRSDGSPQTTEAYQALLDEMLTAAFRMRAERPDVVMSWDDAFAAAARRICGEGR